MKLRTSIVLAFAIPPLAAHAQDLLNVYRDARAYDAQYAAARYALQAGMEKLPLAPLILGHEGIAIVERTGSEVRELAAGDKVAYWSDLARASKDGSLCLTAA